MSAPKPPCVTIGSWLKANLGPRCLAPLTGTDFKALAAAVQIIELYAYDNSPSLIEAFGTVVRRMQPSTQELAFHAVAHVLNWDDRQRIWTGAGLPDLGVVRKCAFER